MRQDMGASFRFPSQVLLALIYAPRMYDFWKSDNRQTGKEANMSAWQKPKQSPPRDLDLLPGCPQWQLSRAVGVTIAPWSMAGFKAYAQN